MSRFIILHQALPPASQIVSDPQDGEDDGIAVIGGTEQSRPLAIAVDQIRSFRPRSGDRVGTRITTNFGVHYPVTETFEVVSGLVVDHRI